MEYQLLLVAAELGYDPKEVQEAAISSGYEDADDQRALAHDFLAFKPPYRCDPYGYIKWIEFCRVLMERDFTPGEEFNLDGIHVKVEEL